MASKSGDFSSLTKLLSFSDVIELRGSPSSSNKLDVYICSSSTLRDVTLVREAYRTSYVSSAHFKAKYVYMKPDSWTIYPPISGSSDDSWIHPSYTVTRYQGISRPERKLRPRTQRVRAATSLSQLKQYQYLYVFYSTSLIKNIVHTPKENIRAYVRGELILIQCRRCLVSPACGVNFPRLISYIDFGRKLKGRRSTSWSIDGEYIY